MDVNVKLQGQKFNFGKVQECFCKILRFQRFSEFTNLFSLREIRRICPRGCGPGPPASAHGSMGFIKCQPLATRSMAWIKPNEPLSRLIISTVHHRSDGWGGWLRPGVAWTRAHGGASRPSGAACRSSMRFAPTRSQRRGELDHCNTRIFEMNRIL
jgi:hypothetical protein